jgi:hypothetical protein
MAGKTPSPAPAQPQRYLSPQEFSRFSGLSLATVHRYLRRGKVRYLQPAGPRGRILIPIDALELFAAAAPAPLLVEATAGASSAISDSPATTLRRLSGPRPLWTRRGGRSPTTEV